MLIIRFLLTFSAIESMRKEKKHFCKIINRIQEIKTEINEISNQCKKQIWEKEFYKTVIEVYKINREKIVKEVMDPSEMDFHLINNSVYLKKAEDKIRLHEHNIQSYQERIPLLHRQIQDQLHRLKLVNIRSHSC